MGGKKTCVKSREWEKERRDKLNVGFNDLSKLLPDHDPSISLSKMDILRKAAEFIRQLQEQNDEIVKSGNNDVLKNETERLRKRVAYLVLKTKDLVNALKAAGVPIPNNNKKKGKNKDVTIKPSNGKDQNLVPSLTGTVVNTIPLMSSGDSNGKEVISGVSSLPMNSTSTKKVKCGCDKAAKKNPLSEVNGASTISPVTPVKGTNVTVVSCSSQTHATILNPSLHLANIENTALTSSLGAGTLIFRDGRVITVPPPSPIIPQILVKPQPTVFVMQRSTPVAVKRDKFPLIFPKRRDITQTTYMNKTPIPAIKTFRLESIKKNTKTSKAKNKKDSKQEKVNDESPSKLSVSGKEEQSSVDTPGVGTSLVGPSTVDVSKITHSSPISQRKRKAEAINRRGKVLKSSSSVSVPSKNEKISSGNLHKNVVTNCGNNPVDDSTVVGLSSAEKSTGISGGVALEIISDSSQVQHIPVTCSDSHSVEARGDVEIESKEVERHITSCQDKPTASEEVCQKDSLDTSKQVGDSKESRQQTLTLDSIDIDRMEKENIITLDSPNTPKELPSKTSISPENCPLFSLSLAENIVVQEGVESCPAGTKEIQNDAECPELHINTGISLPEHVESHEVSKTLDNQAGQISNPTLFSNKDINDDPNSPRTKIDKNVKHPEPNIGGEPNIVSHSETGAALNETPTEESLKQHGTSIDKPEKLPSIPAATSFQKNSSEKNVTPERPSMVHPVECCENINSQYDISIADSVNPDQMFSFDDSVHGQLDPFTAEPVKTQRDCNSSSNVAENLPNSNLNNGKKEKLPEPREMPKDVINSITSCTDTTATKIVTSQDNSSFKTTISIGEQLGATPKSDKHVITETDKHMMTCSGDNHLQSTSTSIPGMGSEKFTISMSSFQSQAKMALVDTAPPTTFTSGSQMYPISMTEQSRTESFFNYDNPIATLPSVDPFFPNFLGKSADVVSTSCITTPTTCSSCTNFTSQVQAPPVRSVARQLFPADSLCSIANSYNLLNNRQSELETNLPHLSAANSQMFQFSSYSSASSYRDPVFFANDFVSTPSKTGANLGSLESFSQNDKGASALHPPSNYTDLLHSTANLNNFPNISCNFTVAPSSSCITTDFIPITSTQSKPSHKQFIINEPQSVSMISQAKQNPKPCSSEGNFSMNMITSSSASKSEIKTHSQCPALDSTGYQKPVNCEASQNLNFNYLHPLSHSQSGQINQEIGYNLYTRDSMPLARSVQNHNFRSTSHVASINSDKNYQKPFNHGLNTLNSSVAKDFNVNAIQNSGGTLLENTRGNGERFSIQSNLFHDTCNQYADHSSKNQHGNSNTASGMSNFQGGTSSQLLSNNQGVQTQQSYLGNSNTQQGPKMSKNATHNTPSGNQSFSGSTQPSNRQNHVIQPDKYSRIVSMKQDLPRSVSGPHYSMKLSGGNRLSNSDAPDCTRPGHHSQGSYQTVSSLEQTSQQVQISNSSQNHVSFSSSNVFSHPNFSNQQRSYQGPIFSSHSSGSRSHNAQTIYTNPTTGVPSNHVYLQGTNTSSAGAAQRGQNILSLNTLSKAGPLHSSQLPIPGNLPPSSAGQMFSTIESLAHHNHDIVGNSSKNINTSSNPAHHQSQSQTTTNPPNGNFPGTSTSQSINISTNRKSAQNDGMPSFSMSSISGYSQNPPLANVENQHPSAKRLHPSGHSYNHLQTSIQNVVVNKSSSQYTSAPTNLLATSKQCDYPLASILTGLNDPILSGTSITNGGSSTHLNKNSSMPDIVDKNSGCREKVVDKQYSTNTEGNSFKTTDNCSTEYLRNKENERNSFIPIMEDVRLNSEFSNDLFSSLQVPTGGAHSDSISPTAAFLLAFPLVSTSKNTENPHEQDPADNNTSTPTTILQIGNIEPPNSELFHPLEFGKDMETSDYLGQVQEKCKRKESVNQEKHKKQVMSNAYPQTYNYPSMSGDFSVTHFEQPWSENQNKSKPVADRKKNEKPPKQFNNSNTYEFCKQDKKKKNKISVNWMAAPDANDSFQKEVETSSFPAANLPFPMDIDGLPDLCNSKKTNSGIYSWSPNKSLMPLDNGLLIPSTLPTLVGDLALGTTTPSDPFSKRCDNKKALEKQLEKNQNPQKSQNNFLSVSQLVDPKSKKQKIPETKCKKQEKKKTASFAKRKDSNEPCMYPDNFLPPLGWDKYRYKNNYSAEALIGSQDINDSLNFPYQQNANYFMGPDFNQDHHPQGQQYQNSLSFSQNQFSTFIAEEYQSDNFSLNQPQASSSKRVAAVEKRDARFLGGANSNPAQYHHPNNMQPPHSYPVRPLPPSSSASSQPSNFTSNTTTSVTNFNLSTIFPEINERTGSQNQQNAASQQQQTQQQHQQSNIQQHPHNSINSFSNNTNNSYQPHNV
uniref:BHLH domain-containing protein n=2 Tax=Lygus hesperus TaxID=30085 RepID=A0A0A9YTV5_LYGHE